MKSRFLVITVFLVLFGLPALADSISFTNNGVLSGNLNSGLVSTANDFAVNNVPLITGPFGTLTFNLGSFTGSLHHGGSFTGGNFELDSSGAVLFATVFSGTWSKVGKGVYDLVGSFSSTSGGLHYTGLVTQTFQVTFNHGRICFVDLNGTTNINVTPVPEPGTFVLLGMGLASVAAPLRRKLMAAAR